MTLTVVDDGEAVEVTMPCAPVAPDHTVRIPTAELELVVNRARSAQLGADSTGSL